MNHHHSILGSKPQWTSVVCASGIHMCMFLCGGKLCKSMVKNFDTSYYVCTPFQLNDMGSAWFQLNLMRCTPFHLNDMRSIPFQTPHIVPPHMGSDGGQKPHIGSKTSMHIISPQFLYQCTQGMTPITNVESRQSHMDDWYEVDCLRPMKCNGWLAVSW